MNLSQSYGTIGGPITWTGVQTFSSGAFVSGGELVLQNTIALEMNNSAGSIVGGSVGSLFLKFSDNNTYLDSYDPGSEFIFRGNAYAQLMVIGSNGAVTAASFNGMSGLANPTGTIGLTTVNGVASTAMRSDAAPALSQAITPTWTGVHNFSTNLNLTGTEGNQLGWQIGGSGQQWHMNLNSGGLLYIQDVTHSRFPFQVAGSAANASIYIGTIGVGITTTTPNALLSLGNAITTIKIAAYDDGVSYYGMGVNSGQLTFGAGLSTVSGTAQMVLNFNGTFGVKSQIVVGNLAQLFTPSTAIFTAHSGTNQNLNISAPRNLASGVSLWSVNDADNTYQPLEIAGSQINLTSGNVGIGAAATPDTLLTVNANTVATSVAPPAGTILHIVGSASNPNARIQVDNFGAAGSPILLMRATGGSIGSMSAVTSGQNLFQMQGQGWDGSIYGVGSLINGYAQENWSGTAHGSYLSFITVLPTTTTFAEQMRIWGSGNVQIGSPYTSDLNFIGLTVSGKASIGAALAPDAILTVNANSSAAVAPSAGTNLHVVGGTGASQMFLDAYGGQAIYAARRAQGSLASPSAMQANQNLCSFAGLGYGATGYSSGARAFIALLSAQNWTDTAQATQINFSTTALNSTTLATAMSIFPSGDVGIGTTTDTNGRLIVTGASQAPSNAGGGFGSVAFTTGSGLTTDNQLIFGVYDGGPSSWIQAVKSGTSWNQLDLNPNSGNVSISENAPTGGGLLIGTPSAPAGTSILASQNLTSGSALVASFITSQWRFVAADGVIPRMIVEGYNAIPAFAFAYAGGSGASPSAPGAGQQLCNFNATGFNGTAFTGGAGGMQVYADAAWSPTSNGTHLDLFTTANGSTYPSHRSVLRVQASGGISVSAGGTFYDAGAGGIVSNGLISCLYNIGATTTNLITTIGSAGAGFGHAVAWNFSSGYGETAFFNNIDGGNTFDYIFYDYTNSAVTPLFYIANTGGFYTNSTLSPTALQGSTFIASTAGQAGTGLSIGSNADTWVAMAMTYNDSTLRVVPYGPYGNQLTPALNCGMFHGYYGAGAGSPLVQASTQVAHFVYGKQNAFNSGGTSIYGEGGCLWLNAWGGWNGTSLTFTRSVTLTNGSQVQTVPAAPTSNTYYVGMPVSGTGIPQGVTFTGQISGTALTVNGTSVTGGVIAVGQQIAGAGVSGSTFITAGSGSNWTVNISQTVSGTVTFTVFATVIIAVNGSTSITLNNRANLGTTQTLTFTAGVASATPGDTFLFVGQTFTHDPNGVGCLAETFETVGAVYIGSLSVPDFGFRIQCGLATNLNIGVPSGTTHVLGYIAEMDYYGQDQGGSNGGIAFLAAQGASGRDWGLFASATGFTMTTTGSIAQISDPTAKKNITKIENVREIIRGIHPVTFDWKDDFIKHSQDSPYKGSGKNWGFISHHHEGIGGVVDAFSDLGLDFSSHHHPIHEMRKTGPYLRTGKIGEHTGKTYTAFQHLALLPVVFRGVQQVWDDLDALKERVSVLEAQSALPTVH
jgi:hypothetical protein